MSSFTNGSGSLRPTWSRNSGSQGGGRGFQPPPAVPPEGPPEGRRRSGSQGSSGSGASSEHRPSNKFAALDDDEDLPPESKLAQSQQSYRRGSTGPNKNLRGRSLADLAATVPDSSNGRPQFRPASRSDSFSEPSVKVTRYTREKLLALRPRPDNDVAAPDEMKKHLEGNPILSDAPLDPVCWDTFDAEEIWAQAMRERTTRSASMITLKPEGGLKPEPPTSRRISASAGFGKWQRGVALPPPDENSHRRGSSGRIDVENPNDLWDDPLASTDADADFSAFGDIPDDPKKNESADPFDFDKMAKQSQQFDDELRGNLRSSDDLQDAVNGELPDEAAVSVTVNPHRPLASIGTTIRSGSGEDVNVFEDFDDNPPPPAAEATSASSGTSEQTSIKSVDEDPTASSRLMKMIGVNREETTLSNDVKPSSLNPWASSEKPDAPEIESSGISGIAVDIPSNPWGESILPVPAIKNARGGGFDLTSRIEQATSEQTSREEMQRRHSQQEAERAHRMQEEERREIEERQRQQEMQQQQQSAPSQVELVLMERISLILENSWGRSDLMSILNTLHSEDSRVIQLLGNIDALKSLISRHPRRIALRQDPAFGAEMSVLLLTNSQFQAQQQEQQQEQQHQQQQLQQQQQQAQARAQQEEITRREQLIQTQNNQQRQNGTSIRIIPNQPWYYSDPQKNIQGPFRGEEMRQWLEAGYFKGDLPISQQTTGPFIPLSAIFPDVALAFRFPEDESDEMAAREEEKRARDEQMHRLAEEKEKKAAMEAAQREMELERQREIAQREMELERERELEIEREREAKAAVEAQKVAMSHSRAQSEQNESSNQLKMMLGLGGGQQSNKSNDEPNLEDEPKATPQIPTQQQLSGPAPAPAKPAWGSVVAGQAKRTKSMAEIQQEEARQAAILAAERRVSGRSSSGGWANVAASRGGSSGWQGGAVKETNPAVVPAINARPAPVKAIHRQSSAPSAMQPARRSSPSEPKPPDDFGASMSTTLESWCKDQMRKLNGSDDLTLVSFCMTLNDPAEIKQYLTAYLGSTPQVNNFATEFINKRGLGNSQQEEWESTKPKKGKKKGGK